MHRALETKSQTNDMELVIDFCIRVCMVNSNPESVYDSYSI